MKETGKKRAWVKDAAIVFLSALLVLTFFSSTIMNRSLPEVAIQTAGSGTINTRISGTGTVTPVETYYVKADSQRTVKTVAVTVGQSVAPGDILLEYAVDPADTTPLEDAKKTLRELERTYQRLLTEASNSAAVSERALKKLQKALDDAVAARDRLAVAEEAYTAAKTEVANAKQSLEDVKMYQKIAQSRVDTAEQNMPSSGGSGDYSAVTAARAVRDAAQEEYDAAVLARKTAELEYGAAYKELVEEAEDWIKKDHTDEFTAIPEDYDKNHKLLTYDADGNVIKDDNGEAVKNPDDAWNKLNDDAKKAEYDKFYNKYLAIYLPAQANKCGAVEGETATETGYTYTHKAHSDAYKAIVAAERNVSDANSALSRAQQSYNDAQSAYNSANSDTSRYERALKALQEARDELTRATNNVTAAEQTLAEAEDKLAAFEEQKQRYDAAQSAVDAAQEALEEEIFNRSLGSSESFALQDARDAVEDQKKVVEKLESGETDDEGATTVVSQVYGVVSSVDITAGNSTSAGGTVMTIVIPDRGYELTFPVTLDQARTVNVGDAAELDNSYWWGRRDITAELVGIRPDPKAPQQNRLLVFSLRGEDIESGSQLTLAIGAKNRAYETVVPKSAVRQDSQGSFVYIIVAKQSPIGNRYQAKRIDVEVAESDDLNSAVTGAIAMGDFVITTSTAPIEDGMYVRLPDT